MHAKYQVSTSDGAKRMAKIKVDNRKDKPTDKETKRTKTIGPNDLILGHKTGNI